ncbi:MAG: L-fucose isomerase [Clostridia bacterium]|nr:L-fucose isomerase [Clostridia bacterium]
MANRLKGSLPKVGIRPVIDGRRFGPRESLDDQTMNMAKSAAALISSTLRHPSGEPVECVISDTCIGGVGEGAECDDKFEREGVSVCLTVTPCWCYGTEVILQNKLIPTAIWGFNGTERPGAVFLAAALAAYNQKGIPAFQIYGKDVQDKNDTSIPFDVEDKIIRFVKAGLAVATMKGKAYLSMGSVSMGIAGSIVKDDFFQDYLGMRNEYVDMIEFIRRIERNICDPEEYKKARKWVNENCIDGIDVNPKPLSQAQREELKDFCVKMTLIAKDLMVGNPRLSEIGWIEESNGHNAIAGGFQGQRQWTDHLPNGDFLESVLCSSFDWNGIRQPYVVATENDSLNGVTMLFGHLLTGAAQVFADVRTYWSPDAIERVTGWKPDGLAANGLIHLTNSGAAAFDGCGEQIKDGKPAMKPHWEITEDEVKKCISATPLAIANTEYFRAGGLCANFATKSNMPITMARVNIIKGLGPVLQLVEGYSVELPEDVHKTLVMRTDPQWPCTWFAPKLTGEGAFKDTYSVMANWGANHGAFSYGHIGADLITLCSMLRIPVCMHNVENERIYRPTAFSAFGTKDLESADFRACQNFGPLYR